MFVYSPPSPSLSIKRKSVLSSLLKSKQYYTRLKAYIHRLYKEVAALYRACTSFHQEGFLLAFIETGGFFGPIITEQRFCA